MTSTINVSPVFGGDIVSLVDGPTIAWGASNGFNYQVTLGGDRKLLAPTGLVKGADYTLIVYNDSAGGRLLSYDEAGYQFVDGIAPTLATAAYSRTILKFYSDGTNLVLISTTKSAVAIPAAPTNFVATGGVGEVSFTWTDNSAIEASYRVQQFDGLIWNAIGDDTAPSATSLSNVPVDPGTYSFRVVALGASGVLSNPSNQATATSS